MNLLCTRKCSEPRRRFCCGVKRLGGALALPWAGARLSKGLAYSCRQGALCLLPVPQPFGLD